MLDMRDFLEFIFIGMPGLIIGLVLTIGLIVGFAIVTIAVLIIEKIVIIQQYHRERKYLDKVS